MNWWVERQVTGGLTGPTWLMVSCHPREGDAWRHVAQLIEGARRRRAPRPELRVRLVVG